jgi:hypothetical protein
MSEFTPEEQKARKRAIFESMAPRRQKHILRRGYDKWDPFLEPKDPIEIRRDTTHRTSIQLFREFLWSRDNEKYSNAYGQAVLDIALGLINNEDRYIAMYEFAVWYRALLEAEGQRPPWHED